MDDNLWVIELESALLDDCNVNDIYSICGGKTIPEALRPDVWQVCLDVRHKNDQMSLFNEIFDLPFQQQLREDCHKTVEKLGNPDEDKVSVVSDLESILTFYCKNRNFQYEVQNGWIELLLPLLSLKLKRSETYNLFEAIRDTYIPKGCYPKGDVFHVLRLLILYHDPELCTMLDTKKISPDLYSIQWFRTLFASTCELPVVLSMWDLYFQQDDPFLIFFLSLIMLINGRDRILAMKDESKENIIKFLTNMPCALDVEDVIDFCSLAQYYAIKTPSSFKTDYLYLLFGSATTNNENSNIVSQALCLPVSVYELVENTTVKLDSPDAVRFFLVDCRPAEQYNAGHLSTAFHLDCDLMLQEPVAFTTAVQGLLRAQRQAIEANSNAGGEHLCFMGSGRLEEDQYAHMVVASFLQKNVQYVSFLTGGYKAIHDYFDDHSTGCLEDHDSKKCIVCTKHGITSTKVINNNNNYKNRNETSSNNISSTSNNSTVTVNGSNENKQTSDFFSKLSAAMKTKSAEVKGKLMDIIVNPAMTQQTHPNHRGSASEGNSSVGSGFWHVSSSERHSGKRYRDTGPVFSIDDENDDQIGDSDQVVEESDASAGAIGKNNEIINLKQYLKSPEIIYDFECQEVHENGYMYDSHLIITGTHLIVVRDQKNGMGQIIVRRLLSSIVKITAKKRHKDLITFKYGYTTDSDRIQVTDMDRFLIPNAKEATTTISNHIVNTTDPK